MSNTPTEVSEDVLDPDAEELGARTAASPMALQSLICERVQPHRADFRTAANIPSSTRLLSRALGRRQVTAQKITEGRWVFRFSGTVIGGWANGVTTLVSAHSRRVLRDAQLTAAHLDLMEVPHVIGEQPTDGIRLVGYVVGQELVSMLALIQPYRVRTDGNFDGVVAGDAPGQVNPEDILLSDSPASFSTAGVVALDVTQEVTEDLHSLALSGVRSIPGLQAGGVELQVASLDTDQEAVVVSVDETADIRPHHYPTLGTGQPVAEALAEQILLTAAL